MESIKEASDSQGFTHSSLRTELGQRCNYSEGKKDKALTGRKESAQESENMGTGTGAGPASLWQKENDSKKSLLAWPLPFRPDSSGLNLQEPGSLVCWC